MIYGDSYGGHCRRLQLLLDIRFLFSKFVIIHREETFTNKPPHFRSFLASSCYTLLSLASAYSSKWSQGDQTIMFDPRIKNLRPNRKEKERKREEIIESRCFIVSAGLKHGNGGIGSASSSRSTSPSQQHPPQALSFIPQPRSQCSTNRQPAATTPRYFFSFFFLTISSIYPFYIFLLLKSYSKMKLSIYLKLRK